VNSNNPYHRGAGWYQANLSLPVISTIRRQEARAVLELVGRYADPAGRALEVGPGTGFYTLALARMFGEVVAVEDSAGMAGILRGRLEGAGARNVTVVEGDFRAVRLEGEFEVVAAIGVLDYIAEPEEFVARMRELARRAVVVTAPQRGVWGSCFAAANRLRGTAVYRHDRGAPGRWAEGWECTVREVGLRTPLTRGLTLVAALERPGGVSGAAGTRASTRNLLRDSCVGACACPAESADSLTPEQETL